MGQLSVALGAEVIEPLMKYFQCLALHYEHPYAFNHHEFETDNPDEIMEEIKRRGFDDVIEIWDIKEQ